MKTSHDLLFIKPPSANCSPPSLWTNAQRIGMTLWLSAMSYPKVDLAHYDMQTIAQQNGVNLGPRIKTVNIRSENPIGHLARSLS